MSIATASVAALAVLALAVSVTGPTDEIQPPAADSGTSHVVAADGSGQFGTISEAVEAAADGDTILVKPGTYSEAIVIDKDITLMGDGPREEIVLTVDEGSIMELRDSDATLTGFTFTGPTSDGVIVSGGSPALEGLVFREVGMPYEGGSECSRPCDSLSIIDGSTATVRGNTFIDGGSLNAGGGAAPRIEGNELTGGPYIPLSDVGEGTIVRRNTVSAAHREGIGIYRRTTALIEGNMITGAGSNGITVGFVESGVDPVIRGNTVSGSQTGISVALHAAPTIEGNTIVDNRTGIAAGDAPGTAIIDNQLTDNQVGITIEGSAGSVTGNTVRGGSVGILISGLLDPNAESPRLIDNLIEGASDRGLVIGARSSPKLSGNRVCDNSTNLVVHDDATPDIDDTNEICEVALAEAE